MAEETPPTVADQVTRLYDIIAGYHATNLLDIAWQLGVWEAITAEPGTTSDKLAAKLGTDPFYTDALCRTAFAFGLLDREGEGWRMGPQFDQILGNPESSFYLAGAARVHMTVGEDYRDYVRHFRAGSRSSYQDHDVKFMQDVAEALKTLPRIFLDSVLPQLPELAGRLDSASVLLDVGCGGGWAVVQFAERFPQLRCVGIDVERHSVALAQKLIEERGLSERCECRVASADEVAEEESYDIVTSFLVVHEIDPKLKSGAFAAIARALKPGGSFIVFDEAYPETDEDLRRMPKRFAALAQWYELTWGNRVNTRSELMELCGNAGLKVTEEAAFSRFHVLVASKA